MNTTPSPKRVTAPARSKNPFQDWLFVSRWITQNLHNRPRNAFDFRPVLFPLSVMLIVLTLLAVVLPPWEQMRDRRVIGQHYDETLPDGRTIKVTFIGWVKSVADLPAAASVGDEIQVTDGGACWIRISNFEWVDP